MVVTREGKEWAPVCTRADRYATSLGFLLSSMKKTLLSLEIVADTRPYTSYECDTNAEFEELDVKSYLTGFSATDRNWRFRDAVADMALRKIKFTFDFSESVFELSISRDVLVNKKLVVLAGQVLVARNELRIRTVIDQQDQTHISPEIAQEQKTREPPPADEIVVPWPLPNGPDRKDLPAGLILERK